MKNNKSFSAMILVSLVLGSTTLSAQANKIVLWNKLGSEHEVLNSKIGPDGRFIGSAFHYEPGQFGNGFVRQSTDSEVVFDLPTDAGLAAHGTMEAWIVPKVSNPMPFEYGIFCLICIKGDTPATGGVDLWWGDGVTGLGFEGFFFHDGGYADTGREAHQFVAVPGIPIHAAITWDIGGIGGTSDTLRVYRDGVIIGHTDEVWNPSGMILAPVLLGYSPDSGGYDKFITDNFIVRDYAKSNFDDRFVEVPSIPEPETYAMLLVGLGLLGFMARRRKQSA